MTGYCRNGGAAEFEVGALLNIAVCDRVKAVMTSFCRLTDSFQQ